MSETNTQQGHQNGYQDYPYSVLQLMYEHDSRENTKRQESSEYPLGSLFLYRPSLESQTGVKDNGAVLVTWLDSVRGSTTHDAPACNPLAEIEPSCYRKIGRRYEMCDSMGGKGRPWLP